MSSVIYQHPLVYRAVMTVLYGGSYRSRYKQLFPLLRGTSIVELCFGDTLLAGWCRDHRISWTGFDISQKFVHCAVKKGFDAHLADLRQLHGLPEATTCVMAGSLYHFHPHAEELLEKMLQSSGYIVLSEPVKNLSQLKGPLGWIARRSGKTAGGKAEFRYDRERLLNLLEQFAQTHACRLTVAGQDKKDLIVQLEK